MFEYVSEYMDYGKEDYLIMDFFGLVEFNEDVVMNFVKFYGFMKLIGVEFIIIGILLKFVMILICYEENLVSLIIYSIIKEVL